jgi:hypothetical protein
MAADVVQDDDGPQHLKQVSRIKHWIRTARVDQRRIHFRLKAAAEDHEARYGGEKA